LGFEGEHVRVADLIQLELNRCSIQDFRVREEVALPKPFRLRGLRAQNSFD
jgi:hypothetical protein